MKHSIYLERFISLCYDFLFVAITSYLFWIGLTFINNQWMHIEYFNVITIIVCVIIYILEYTLLPLKLKGTLGHYLNDLNMEAITGRITVGRLLFREVLLKHLLYVTIIGFIVDIVFFIIKKQTMHDYFLQTKIIKKKILEEEELKKRKSLLRFFVKNK